MLKTKFSRMTPPQTTSSSLSAQASEDEDSVNSVSPAHQRESASPIVESLSSHFSKWRPELLPLAQSENVEGVS